MTGASGYVGSRLVPVLKDCGARVRVCGRHMSRLDGQPWRASVEALEADLTDRLAVRAAVSRVDVVVFLVHEMAAGSGFADLEARMARHMAEEAARAGVRRIVYLSGLHPESGELSEHKESRRRVGAILRAGTVPTTVLEAATVIGAGSASFEIIRHLSERLPVMPAPRCARNRIEPVAIDDVLHYLAEATVAQGDVSGTYGVGSGESDLCFEDLLTNYAEVPGLHRSRVLSLPLPARLLSGGWIGMVTPVPLSLAVPLAQSMQHEAATHGDLADHVLPAPAGGATSYRAAVRSALEEQRFGVLASRWDNDIGQHRPPASPADPDWSGHTVYTDERTVERSDADPRAVWRVIEGIGGHLGGTPRPCSGPFAASSTA